jgi:hypothetical protein
MQRQKARKGGLRPTLDQAPKAEKKRRLCRRSGNCAWVLAWVLTSAHRNGL